MADCRTIQNRRRFLRGAALASTAVIAAPTLMNGRTLGFDGQVAANERITLAGFGIGGRGGYDLGVFMEQPEIQFVAIADIRKDRREGVRQRTEEKYGPGVDMYRDFREMLPRTDIDCLLIATGDRWHAMASMMAARAGKDVYCEKPCTMTIAESLAMETLYQRYGRVYQAGTQRRSVANFQFATELCHSGKLGKLKTVHANTLHPAVTHDWKPSQEQPPIDEVDWDMWLGPCPWRPYNKEYIDGGWRGFFDFHGGGILEWGSHTVDQCNWAACNDSTLPYLYEPNERGCVATYKDGLKLVMRDSGWMGLGTCSVRYEGEDGWVETGDSGRLEFGSSKLRSEQRAYSEEGTSANSHVRNFLDAVKTRRQAHSRADIVARSHIICHAAYIAWQLKCPLELDLEKYTFVGDEEANRMISRPIREPWYI